MAKLITSFVVLWLLVVSFMMLEFIVCSSEDLNNRKSLLHVENKEVLVVGATVAGVSVGIQIGSSPCPDTDLPPPPPPPPSPPPPSPPPPSSPPPPPLCSPLLNECKSSSDCCLYLPRCIGGGQCTVVPHQPCEFRQCDQADHCTPDNMCQNGKCEGSLCCFGENALCDPSGSILFPGVPQCCAGLKCAGDVPVCVPV